MRLLLQRNIEKLGNAGDLVEVSSGYARNYLLPHGLAMVPSEVNLKKVEQLRAAAKQQDLRLLREFQDRAQTLDGLEVSLKARANELGHLFGSVGPADVSVALQEMGFDVPDQKVSLDGHIKEIGEYEIQVKFADEAVARIKLSVLPETPVPEWRQDLEQDEQEDDSAAAPQSLGPID